MDEADPRTPDRSYSSDTPEILCKDCADNLSKNHAFCMICAAPFATYERHTRLVCGQCQKSPPAYTTSLIPYLYAPPLKQLIADLKFHGNLYFAPLLAQLFINAINYRQINRPDCIIPVPLHISRLRERGFNQALEVAKIIANQTRIPLDYSLVQRTKVTPFQSGLSAKQRRQNLRNAFEVAKPHSYKHVVIFDDVVTTGTTVNELAKKLKQSGIDIIEIWAIARTYEKNS